MGALQDTHIEPYYAVGVHDNVVIVIWRSPLEPEAVGQLDKRLKAAAKANPEGIGLVSVAKDAHGVAAGLKRLNPNLGRHAPTLRAVAHAIEGEGPSLTLSRLFAGMGLNAPKPTGVAYKVVQAGTEAAVFVVQQITAAGIEAPQASALTFSIEHLRQRVAP